MKWVWLSLTMMETEHRCTMLPGIVAGQVATLWRKCVEAPRAMSVVTGSGGPEETPPGYVFARPDM
jgi:hypothetical protein